MKNKFGALIFFALLVAIVISLFVMLSKHANGEDKIILGGKSITPAAYLKLKNTLNTKIKTGISKSEAADLKAVVNAEKNAEGKIEIKNFNGKLTDILSAILQK